jgi:hypothetical protein
MASFSSGVSGHEVEGVIKCVVVRHTGHVRSACGAQAQRVARRLAY